MTKPRVDRREFLRDLAGSTAALSILPRALRGAGAPPAGPPKLKFAVIGINHSHINSQVGAVLRGGGELVSVYAKEPDLLDGLREAVSRRRSVARSEDEILEDRVDPARPQLRDSRSSARRSASA